MLPRESGVTKTSGRGSVAYLAFVAQLLCASALGLQGQSDDRIATPGEIRNAVKPSSLTLLRAVSYPHRRITGEMERGLVAFQRGRVRERLYLMLDRWRKRGVIPKFGGMGEGSGFGGGLIYQFHPAEKHTIQTMALVTLSRYQELEASWSSVLPASRLYLEASYQWRPRENYYGQGHASLQANHTSFALRQSWTGLRYEVNPRKRFRLGALSRWEWVTATQGENYLYPPITSYFPALPGFRQETRLNSTGAYLDLDGLREEYQLGGAAHLGASYQQSFGGAGVRYFALDMQLEGRTPIKLRNSVLVGQANFQMNRERGGSDPIPFYLQPRIGGATSLRGYPLDRFYGRSLALLTLEYRIRVHPNIQFYPLFDEGQIFDRTSDLSWLNWHRTYGFGFRVRSATATALRVELGWGGEGTQLHIVFGDRVQPPMRSAIRYGGYRR